MIATNALTDRQCEIRDYILAFYMARGCSPTIREIAEHFKLNVNAIQNHLVRLEKKGAITRFKNVDSGIRSSRNMRIVGACPCCGREME
jgi:repressor LexA